MKERRREGRRKVSERDSHPTSIDEERSMICTMPSFFPSLSASRNK